MKGFNGGDTSEEKAGVRQRWYFCRGKERGEVATTIFVSGG